MILGTPLENPEEPDTLGTYVAVPIAPLLDKFLHYYWIKS